MQYFNAHCHLELGWLRGRIPPGLPFAEWLARVVAEKRAVTPAESEASTRAGLEELRRTGTVAIADVLSMDTALPALLAATDLQRIAYFESIRFEESQAEPAIAEALSRQALAHPSSPIPHPSSLLLGLSPHAPYTTTTPLIQAAVRESKRLGQWLCIHAAETPEETLLIAEGRGPLADFLAPVMERTGWRPPMMRPIAWLDACGAIGPSTLLVHVNDATDEEFALLAARGTRVVVCPGTHRYFGRGAFPLGRLLAAGVRCHLGTDSLASNEALDMDREVRLACAMTPQVAPDRISALADASGADDFLRPPA